ncbi:MAG TPA: glycosyltransferase family 2 protein [Candidatus Tumulicola sp.]
MSQAKISFVAISYNRRDQVKSLLESVYRGDRVPDEVIVVDNASRDDTVGMLAREFPNVRVIANAENFMGSYAVNQGIVAATSEFVYVTADDNVVDPHCIGELAEVMASLPDAGLVAPVMYYYDAPERVWFAGCDVNMLTGLTRFFVETPRERYVETTCMPNCYMVRRRMLESIGGQDHATFPFHHEEADFSFRAAKAGYASYVARDAREWHKTPVPKHRPIVGSGDFSIDDPDRAYYHARSRALLARRHAGLPVRIAFFTLFFPPTVAAYVAICAVTSRAHGRTSLAFIRGALHGLTMPLPDPPPPLLAKDGETNP